jgi:hypothetical protein
VQPIFFAQSIDGVYQTSRGACAVGVTRVYPTVGTNSRHGVSTDAPADADARSLRTLCFVNIMIDDHNLWLQATSMELSFVNRKSELKELDEAAAAGGLLVFFGRRRVGKLAACGGYQNPPHVFSACAFPRERRQAL